MDDSSAWSSSESSSNLWDLFVPTHKIKTEELFVCHCKGLWLWEAHNHRKEPWRKNGASKSTARSLTGKGMFDACPFKVHTLQAPRLHFHPDMRLREFLANCSAVCDFLGGLKKSQIQSSDSTDTAAKISCLMIPFARWVVKCPKSRRTIFFY